MPYLFMRDALKDTMSIMSLQGRSRASRVRRFVIQGEARAAVSVGLGVGV